MRLDILTNLEGQGLIIKLDILVNFEGQGF